MLKNGLTYLTMKKMVKGRFQQIKTKKVYGLFKDELRGKIMKEFCTLRVKTYAYLMNDDSEKKKSKGTKK